MNKHVVKPGSLHAPRMEAPASGNASTLRERQEPTHEQISRRAYEIFLARGGTEGDPVEDWVQAERELKLGC